MRLHNAGKYSGNENDLPQREHPVGYVPFKEPENMKKFALQMNFLAIAILIVTLGLFYFRLFKWHLAAGDPSGVFGKGFILGFALYLATLIPHEFLHAIWFKEDVYYYHNLKHPPPINSLITEFAGTESAGIGITYSRNFKSLFASGYSSSSSCIWKRSGCTYGLITASS